MSGALAIAPIVAVALPLVLAAAISVPGLRPAVLRAAPWAALPAFAIAVSETVIPTWQADAVLLGMTIGNADAVTRAFLVLTASVWLAAGLFAKGYLAADPRRFRFWMFFLLAEAGNLGLVLAQDVASFYLFFAVMTYAAYVLVVHVQTAAARRAAAAYLVMALLGEVLLLAAFVLLVGVDVNLPLREAAGAVARSGDRNLVVGLLLAGFGIKAGALVLHVWLPLAHPVAPTPASAALSGAMIKAGLLGWLRFLPLGLVPLPDAGLVCLVAGFAAAFYAALVGLAQHDPKTILAYSSVSQMGFVTAALGIALAVPASAAAALAAILFYALHHALAKAALFLGAAVASATRSCWPRRLAVLGLVVSALDLAGAPLSSGSLAKISLAQLVTDHAALGALLSAGAVASTLLMAKLVGVVVARREPVDPRRGLWASWLLLLALDLVFLVSPPVDRERLGLLVDPAHVASAAWPVIAGIAIAVAVRALRRQPGPHVPPGDLIVVFELAYRSLRYLVAATVLAVVRIHAKLRAWAYERTSPEQRWSVLLRAATRFEVTLSTFASIGAALLLLGGVLVWLSQR